MAPKERLASFGPALERDPERLLHALAIQYCSMTLGFFPDAVSELLRIPTETCDPGADIRCFPDADRCLSITEGQNQWEELPQKPISFQASVTHHHP